MRPSPKQNGKSFKLPVDSTENIATMTSMSSNTAQRIVPVNSSCPAHFALGYLRSSIILLKEECDRANHDANVRVSLPPRIEREIERLALDMEQINRELYPDLT